MKLRRPASSSPSPAVSVAARAAAAPAPAPGLGARGEFLADPPIQRRVREARKDGLPDGLRGSLEALSGISLDHVKVRYNSKAPDEVGAHAFTKGHEIHLARGQEQHLAHEAWHVVQQARRRVRATGEVAGQALNDDHRLEREADLMGDRAMRMAASPSPAADPVSAPAPVPTQAPIQRDEWATDKLREEAQAMAHGFKTPGYTMHHKVAKSKLKDLAKVVAAKTSAKAAAFKAKVAEVTHHSLVKKGQDVQGGVLGDQLANMPMNIELGPLDDFREDKPGTNFDPNTVPVPATDDQTGAMEDATAPPLVVPQPGAVAAVPGPPRPLRRRMSLRSFHLKKIDDIINAGVPITDDHLEEMTNALEAAHRVHVDTHAALGKLTAPDETQWAERGQLTRKDGSKVSSYLRRGSAFTGGPGATGFLKEQAKEETRQRLARERIRAEAEAAAASKRQEAVSKLNDRFRRSNMSQEDFEALAKKHGVKTSEYDGIFKNLAKYRGGVKRDRKVKADDVIAHFTKHFPIAEEPS